MRSLKVGVTLPQFTGEPRPLLEAALRAEEVGLDSVWLFDHLWPLSGGKERPVLECWTTLAWVAAKTERVRVGSLVTRSSLRNPLLLAKMVATAASIAPGRVIAGIGSGDELSRPENEAFGIPYYAGPSRREQLRATIEVVRGFFDGRPIEVEGRPGAGSGPRSGLLPADGPRPQLWVGASSRSSVELAAEHADGWNAWQVTPQRFEVLASLVERGDRELAISWGGILILGSSDGAARARLGPRDPAGYLVGSPATVADALLPYAEAGATHLTLTLGGSWDPQDLDRLAQVKDFLT